MGGSAEVLRIRAEEKRGGSGAVDIGEDGIGTFIWPARGSEMQMPWNGCILEIMHSNLRRHVAL